MCAQQCQLGNSEQDGGSMVAEAISAPSEWTIRPPTGRCCALLCTAALLRSTVRYSALHWCATLVLRSGALHCCAASVLLLSTATTQAVPLDLSSVRYRGQLAQAQDRAGIGPMLSGELLKQALESAEETHAMRGSVLAQKPQLSAPVRAGVFAGADTEAEVC